MKLEMTICVITITKVDWDNYWVNPAAINVCEVGSAHIRAMPH